MRIFYYYCSAFEQLALKFIASGDENLLPIDLFLINKIQSFRVQIGQELGEKVCAGLKKSLNANIIIERLPPIKTIRHIFFQTRTTRPTDVALHLQ